MRRVRRLLRILIPAILIFIALEVFLAITGIVPAPIYNQHVSHFTLPDLPPGGLKLDPNPQFHANDRGFWVASEDEPGVNAEGFRSPPFDEPEDGRPAVMFLGDHVTYGYTATPVTNSFVDLVRHVGYRTFNLAAPDTGPIHYAALAEFYVPRLKPDVVVLCFYTANDYNAYPPFAPNMPLTYYTNAGVLPARSEIGALLTPEESYERWRKMFGHGLDSALSRILLRSRLITLGLGALGSAGAGSRERDTEALQHLRRIRDIAKEHGAAFLLCVVPASPLYRTDHNSPERAREILKDLDPRIPDNLSPENYADPPMAYLNNLGHARYSRFVVKQLVGLGVAPVPGTDDASQSVDSAAPKLGDVINLDDVVDWVKIDPDSRAAVYDALLSFRQHTAEILFTPPAEGKPSPGEMLAREQPAPAELQGPPRSLTLLKYAAENTYPPAGSTYTEVVAELEKETLEKIQQFLTPTQRVRWQQLKIDTLLRIDIGANPLEARVSALSQSLSQ